MAVDSATAAAAASSSTKTAKSSNALTDLGSNFNSFLTLLTTQLKNQDPSSPIDSNQFTQQLVAFTGVQQQVNTNAYLEKILAGMQTDQVSNAASYVGTTVEATGSKGALYGGYAQFGYSLTSAAGTVDVTITNSAGQVVFSGTGGKDAGKNIVTWDGTNSNTGAKEKDGIYNISVKAKDGTGSDVSAKPFIVGVVDSASIDGGVVQLGIGPLQIPVSDVTNVSNVTKAKADSTTTTTAS